MDISSISNLRQDGTTFNEIAAVKKARDDFRYVCSQSNLSVMNNIDLFTVVKNTVKLADFLPVPFDVKARITRIPAAYVRTDNPKMYVAVICYVDDRPTDILLYNSSCFARKSKPVGYDKKTNEYIIKIKNTTKEQKNAFGIIIPTL